MECNLWFWDIQDGDFYFFPHSKKKFLENITILFLKNSIILSSPTIFLTISITFSDSKIKLSIPSLFEMPSPRPCGVVRWLAPPLPAALLAHCSLGRPARAQLLFHTTFSPLRHFTNGAFNLRRPLCNYISLYSRVTLYLCIISVCRYSYPDCNVLS